MRFLGQPVLLRFTGIALIVLGLFVPPTVALITFIMPETFGATTRFAFDTPSVATNAQEILSPPVLTMVSRKWELPQEWARRYKLREPLPEELALKTLRERTAVTVDHRARILDISVYSEDVGEVAYLANSFGDAFIELNQGNTNVRVIQAAVRPAKPVRPNKVLNIASGLVAGMLMISAGFVLLAFARSRAKMATQAPPPLPVY